MDCVTLSRNGLGQDVYSGRFLVRAGIFVEVLVARLKDFVVGVANRLSLSLSSMLLKTGVCGLIKAEARLRAIYTVAGYVLPSIRGSLKWRRQTRLFC